MIYKLVKPTKNYCELFCTFLKKFMNLNEFISRVIQLNFFENDKIQLFWETGRGLEETEHIIKKDFLDWINTNSKINDTPVKRILFDKGEVEKLGPEFTVNTIPMPDGNVIYEVIKGFKQDRIIPIEVKLSFNKEYHLIDGQMAQHIYDIKKI